MDGRYSSTAHDISQVFRNGQGTRNNKPVLIIRLAGTWIGVSRNTIARHGDTVAVLIGRKGGLEMFSSPRSEIQAFGRLYQITLINACVRTIGNNRRLGAC